MFIIISIGILAWNEAEVMATTLRSLLEQSLVRELAQSGHRLELVVVPNGCSDLTDMLETKKLEVVDADTIMELSTFEASGSSYEASIGNHDDTVMPLVLFGWFAATDIFANISSVDLKSMLYSERLTILEDDIAPVGVFSADEDSKQKYFVEGGEVWTAVQPSTLY